MSLLAETSSRIDRDATVSMASGALVAGRRLRTTARRVSGACNGFTMMTGFVEAMRTKTIEELLGRHPDRNVRQFAGSCRTCGATIMIRTRTSECQLCRHESAEIEGK